MRFPPAVHRRSAIAWVGPALVLLMAPLAAQSASDGSTIAVSATVVSTCAVTASALAFGNYSMAQSDSAASMNVTCTNGTPFTVSSNAGLGSGASVATRKMTGPSGQTLNYSLFQDAGRTTLWGQTTGTDTVAGTGTGASQTMSVYGRIPAGQGAAAGVYTDTVTVTVTY